MKPVDQLEITVLVDNTTDSLSSNPDFVETEFAFLRRHGMKWLSGKCLCCAAHGLSCLMNARMAAGTAQRHFPPPGARAKKPLAAGSTWVSSDCVVPKYF